MPEPGFAKIKSSDAMLHGPRALLLCGFSDDSQSKLKSLLDMLGLASLPLIWASADQSKELVRDLFQQEDGFGKGSRSNLPRAIIVGGIKEKELHHLMTGCRKAGMKQALWATLTPSSGKWSLGRLLKELQAERKVLSSKRPSTGH